MNASIHPYGKLMAPNQVEKNVSMHTGIQLKFLISYSIQKVGSGAPKSPA